MSQDRILNILKKNKRKWFTSRELAKMLKISQSTSIKNLYGLKSAKFVRFRTIFRKIRRNVAQMQYRHKTT